MRRSILVTGAGSGIGCATVLQLADAGFQVVAAVRHHEERLRLHEALTRRHEGRFLDLVSIRRVELASEREREALVDGLQVWGLANIAGYLNAGEIMDVGLGAAREQLEVHLVAPAHLAHLLVPGMAMRGEGRIVNVTSAVVYAAAPLMGWYRSSKAALAALTDALRLELASLGIDVVAIEPGGVDTPLWDRTAEELRERSQTAVRQDTYRRAGLILAATRRLMRQPDDVAAAIVKAFTTGKPRPRYRVGLDAKLLHVAEELLPEPLRDRIAETLAGAGA